MDLEISKDLSRSVVRALRGRHSQNFANKRLGLRSNRMAKWEGGQAQVPWSSFIDLIELAKVEPQKLLRESLLCEGDPRNIGELLVKTLGDQGRETLSSALSISARQANRILSGESEPTLAQVLVVFPEAQTYALLHQLGNRLGTHLTGRFVRYDIVGDINARFPYATTLLYCLRLKAYRSLERHQPGFLADLLGFPHAEEQEILGILSSNNLIKFDGRLYDWVSESVPDSLRMTNPETQQCMRRYWSRYLLDFHKMVQRKPENAFGGFMTMVINAEDYPKIREAVREAVYKISDLSQSSSEEGPQKVAMVCLNLIDVEEYRDARLESQRLR